MPSQIALFLPFIAAFVSYILQQEHFPPSVPKWAYTWINGGIALITIVLAVTADLFIQNKLTGNIWGDMMLVGIGTTALQVETYRPLQQYLREVGFAPQVQVPKTPMYTETIPTPTVQQPIVLPEPTPIVLPAEKKEPPPTVA